MVNIGNEWDEYLKEDFESENYKKLRETLKKEYTSHKVYPDMYCIFNALKLTDYSAVKVVILGQDPYHGDGQAHGLSFSVQKGVPLPPSLKNIFDEVKSDIGVECGTCGDLTAWAERGVLLLNAALTVRASEPMSHSKIGWALLTDSIISKLNIREKPVVFILWGSFARSKKLLITNPRHLIVESAHPSPLSANYGFFGSHPFSKANNFLEAKGIEPVDWNLL
ncbi:MAG: uracil-DNA glycosylase [Clostridiaceae bacterium]|jgi:uracil-DNA glycosylase|nr:uracil-DNA glycosylase [Clostridiaceae bacterium]